MEHKSHPTMGPRGVALCVHIPTFAPVEGRDKPGGIRKVLSKKPSLY